jgi:hypothetical protein
MVGMSTPVEAQTFYDTVGGHETFVALGPASTRSLPTSYRWRSKGDGSVGYRVGRHVRYRPEAVEAWLEQQADKR